MSEVVPLFDSAPVPGQPNELLVSKLEDLLARARIGEIHAIAYTTISGSEAVGTGWIGEGQANLMLGGIAALQIRYTQCWVDMADKGEG